MTFFVVSELGNFYLDVCGGKKDPGTKLIGYPYNGGKNQQFCLKDNHIFSVDSGLVMDAHIDNGQIIINTMNKSANQLWFFQDDGSIRNCYNQCLTLIQQKSNSKQGDIYLSLWENRPNQKWRIVTTAV